MWKKEKANNMFGRECNTNDKNLNFDGDIVDICKFWKTWMFLNWSKINLCFEIVGIWGINRNNFIFTKVIDTINISHIGW